MTTQMIELTAKKYKAQSLISSLLLWLLPVGFMVAVVKDVAWLGAVFMILFALTIVWKIVVRFLIWWNHK